MTLPQPWKRSTAAERRQARAEFQLLKAECLANPSPEIQAHTEKARRDDTRSRAQKKIRRMLAGKGSRPFSEKEMAMVKPAELETLRQHSAGRFASLSQEARDRLRDRLYLILLTLDDEAYRAVAG